MTVYETTACETCGGQIEAIRRREVGRRRWCSAECKLKRVREGEPDSRICRKCGETREIWQFQALTVNGKPYRKAYCRDCDAERSRLGRYGVTLAEVLEAQGGTCSLCQVEAATVLDHDHMTGKLRGAVCRRCNFALHYLDDPDWLKRTEDYLARGK